MNSKGFVHSLVLGTLALAFVGATVFTISQYKQQGQVLGENENDNETEIETNDLKIKTKIEDNGERKIEIESTRGAKLKYEEHKKVSESAEVEDGDDDIEVEDDDRDEATKGAVVRQLIKDKVIDRVSTGTGSFNLELKNNKMVFKVEGFKTKKIFGLIPVELRSTSFVATDSAQLVFQVQSFWDRILSFISF